MGVRGHHKNLDFSGLFGVFFYPKIEHLLEQKVWGKLMGMC